MVRLTFHEVNSRMDFINKAPQILRTTEHDTKFTTSSLTILIGQKVFILL